MNNSPMPDDAPNFELKGTITVNSVSEELPPVYTDTQQEAMHIAYSALLTFRSLGVSTATFILTPNHSSTYSKAYYDFTNVSLKDEVPPVVSEHCLKCHETQDSCACGNDVLVATFYREGVN